MGKKPVGRSKTRQTNYVEDLIGWNRVGLHLSEMIDVMEDHEVYWLILELLPRNLHGKAGNVERKTTD